MSFKDFQAYTLAIARGEIKPGSGDPKEFFDSEETRLRKFRETLPADIKFDRDKANKQLFNKIDIYVFEATNCDLKFKSIFNSIGMRL